jgi:hypothetical protein
VEVGLIFSATLQRALPDPHVNVRPAAEEYL